jgi:hypothetical protein
VVIRIRVSERREGRAGRVVRDARQQHSGGQMRGKGDNAFLRYRAHFGRFQEPFLHTLKLNQIVFISARLDNAHILACQL